MTFDMDSLEVEEEDDSEDVLDMLVYAVEEFDGAKEGESEIEVTGSVAASMDAIARFREFQKQEQPDRGMNRFKSRLEEDSSSSERPDPRQSK